ncbi:hypothetical protein DS891_07810 [Pseudoalteromonas sp. JC28]|nr:hypothetical protein [Pseudoalteromonas sp. JC28]
MCVTHCFFSVRYFKYSALLFLLVSDLTKVRVQKLRLFHIFTLDRFICLTQNTQTRLRQDYSVVIVSKRILMEYPKGKDK